MKDKNRVLDYIAAVSDKYDIALDEQRREYIADHLLYVLKMNEKLNLTAIKQLEEGLLLHVEDSLLACRLLVNAPKGPYGDLGSGGGYPGIPLGIASGRKTILIDSSTKKAKAINDFLFTEGLSPQIRAVAKRVEEYALEEPGSFSVLTARALASLPVLVELASPLLENEGEFVAFKARLADEELDAGNRAAALVGFELVGDSTMMLSDGESVRRQLVYRKTGESQIKLPRRNGVAQKRPLA